jgi:selenocysteine lyase/cysteine desulfurase
MDINQVIHDESMRQRLFPVAEQEVFVAHSAVTALPAAARDAMIEFARQGAQAMQEGNHTDRLVNQTRTHAARLINAQPGEIALLGPTSLGLNLVAAGLDWQPGDQVIYYADDYPANVYCWMDLARRGVEPVALETEQLGVIDWPMIQPLITDRTRLVSLASCHFVSGYRIDLQRIGRELHERGILFCVDGIQTVGAFATDVRYVDFLAADSHKWLLGPCGAGFFYVKPEHFDRLRPALLGSWNVQSPGFIAQRSIDFYAGGRRFEPGTLNLPGIIGMNAAMKLLIDLDPAQLGRRIIELRRWLVDRLSGLGLTPYLGELEQTMEDTARSGIASFVHESADLKAVKARLDEQRITVTVRQDRAGRSVLRIAPHGYNTIDELERLAEALDAAL